jgi:patatin-like phospholipase/acyl hydrolase
MAKYRVLALDGGGIRGIVTVVLLQRLGEQLGLAGWLDKVDLIAGTSTGGLLALSERMLLKLGSSARCSPWSCRPRCQRAPPAQRPVPVPASSSWPR